MSFVPADFWAPETLETEGFRLRMLSVNDLVKDYDAVMSSKAHLQKVWRTKWPEGLTLEQNLVDLGWHQKEFQKRSSFAYTVVAPDESRVLGCVYIYPTSKKGFDAEVYYWARQDQLDSELEAELGSALKQWFADTWPFDRVAFPGKDIAWVDWEKIEDEEH